MSFFFQGLVDSYNNALCKAVFPIFIYFYTCLLAFEIRICLVAQQEVYQAEGLFLDGFDEDAGAFVVCGVGLGQ